MPHPARMSWCGRCPGTVQARESTVRTQSIADQSVALRNMHSWSLGNQPHVICFQHPGSSRHRFCAWMLPSERTLLVAHPWYTCKSGLELYWLAKQEHCTLHYRTAMHTTARWAGQTAVRKKSIELMSAAGLLKMPALLMPAQLVAAVAAADHHSQPDPPPIA